MNLFSLDRGVYRNPKWFLLRVGKDTLKLGFFSQLKLGLLYSNQK